MASSWRQKWKNDLRKYVKEAKREKKRVERRKEGRKRPNEWSRSDWRSITWPECKISWRRRCKLKALPVQMQLSFPWGPFSRTGYRAVIQRTGLKSLILLNWHGNLNGKLYENKSKKAEKSISKNQLHFRMHWTKVYFLRVLRIFPNTSLSCFMLE